MFFTVAPWTRIWTMNSLLHDSTAVALVADNPFVRGFISGIGVIHVIYGVRELMRLARARRSGVR